MAEVISANIKAMNTDCRRYLDCGDGGICRDKPSRRYAKQLNKEKKMSTKHRFYRMWYINTIALTLTAAGSLATACFAFTHWFVVPRLAAVSRSSIPSFDDAFFVPWNAPKEEPEDERSMPSQDQLNAALPDAWVLFHGVMKDLKAGRISCECAAERARTLARKVADDDVYDEFPDHYYQNGEPTALAFLLRQAAEKISPKEKD